MPIGTTAPSTDVLDTFLKEGKAFSKDADNIVADLHAILCMDRADIAAMKKDIKAMKTDIAALKKAK